MATLLQVFETECQNLTTRTRFEYATLEEANASIFDKLASGDFPVLLILPFDPIDDRSSGSVKSTAEVEAIFIDRVNGQTTIDTITKEIENTVIAPMRALTREWINRVDDSDIIDEDGITSVTHRSTHEAIMDAHLYGNWARFTIKYTEGNSLCIPH